MANFKTEEEKAYIKKRLISYFESGLFRAEAYKQLKISEHTFNTYFRDDEDIQKALEYVPKRKTRKR